ncbi:MAG: hypothetical protein KME50_16460 [Nostoc desertorum CM1-VF14]|nr:hypothetical protein [Nostoc desertorum CM1-VF14]
MDSTSCLQAKVSFRESERRFSPIFNGSCQFIGLLITEGIVLEVNQKAFHLGELQPQDVVECPYWEIIWWALLVKQQYLQYLLSFSPAVIYSCKSSTYSSTFIRKNIAAIMRYQAREMLEAYSFWASELHPLLESFYRAAPLIL